jgi:nitroimidazol reductase NimA-like FMN-containing flavoprotein (pyridoxamine 5'-phosphate oxidase superfamily)
MVIAMRLSIASGSRARLGVALSLGAHRVMRHCMGNRMCMERQDIDAELSVTGARELLDSTSAAHLAYIGNDGAPRVIPVGFFWTGDEFVISTATTSPKVAALSTHTEVALAIDAGNTPDQARSLSIRGRASVEIVDGVVKEYVAAARRTMDTDAAAEFEQNVRRMYDQMARIAITPTWVRYYDFGAGRMPRFLQELAAKNQP